MLKARQLLSKWLGRGDPPVVLERDILDNGAAALRALLLSAQIDVPSETLRGLLRTDRSGTSIDYIETVANQLGMPVAQQMAPIEHITLPERHAVRRPAIVIVEAPDTSSRFLLVWRCEGKNTQVMDTEQGALWVDSMDLRSQLRLHDQGVAAQDIEGWLRSEDFLNPLRYRLRSVPSLGKSADGLIKTACSTDGWYGIAALDAALRWTENSAQKASPVGLEDTFKAVMEAPKPSETPIPRSDWTVWAESTDVGEVILRGTVFVAPRPVA